VYIKLIEKRRCRNLRGIMENIPPPHHGGREKYPTYRLIGHLAMDWWTSILSDRPYPNLTLDMVSQTEQKSTNLWISWSFGHGLVDFYSV
jgi:hypothetical protein